MDEMQKKAESLQFTGFDSFMDTQDPNFFDGMIRRTILPKLPIVSVFGSGVVSAPIVLKKATAKKTPAAKVVAKPKKAKKV